MFLDDELDDLMKLDSTAGSDEVKCPYCGADIPASLFFDEEIDCPKCGKRFNKNEST